jgi:hypothetical protein
MIFLGFFRYKARLLQQIQLPEIVQDQQRVRPRGPHAMISDGPLPYRTDTQPPNYVDLILNDEDLPSYDEATIVIREA